jgi:predicted amidophosphoribosyltransferase
LPKGEICSYCTRCLRDTSSEMTHCIECEACVEDLDHHCSFFGKCIAGRQRFAFYGFITFVFIGFITFLGTLAVLLNPS